MANCKDCLGFEFCLDRLGTTKYYDNAIAANNVEELCQKFKDRNRFVELPCKVGDTVYVIDDMGDEEYLVAPCTISAIRYECKETDSKIIIMTEGFLAPFTNSWVLGKTVFLTREEAEQALKESKNDE